jgi:CheY-like chemotaxis protein
VITYSNLAADMPDVPHLPDEQQPIVIADATEENASHVERQLRRAGIKNPVVTFQNGDDLNAFLADYAQKNLVPPCVLFLDPKMPGANGYDPVRWMRREKGGDEVLVAVFSSTDDADEKEHAAELGVQIFLKKLPDLNSLAPILARFGGTPPAEAAAAPELPTAPVG